MIHIARSIPKIGFKLLVLHDIRMQISWFICSAYTRWVHYDITQNLLYLYIGISNISVIVTAIFKL